MCQRYNFTSVILFLKTRNNQIMKRSILMLAMFFTLSTAFTSCREVKEEENEMEMEMEEEMDEMDNDMDNVGEDIEDAANDVGDAVENAANETGEAVEDAANEVEDELEGNDDY